MLNLVPTVLMGCWVVLPFAMWLYRLTAQRRVHGFLLYAGVVVVGYVLFVGCAWTADVALEQRMNSFDLDGDGGIGGEELTPEAQEALDAWASDTGRSLAIFTGLPLTGIWAAVCLVPLCGGEWMYRRLVRPSQPATTSAGEPRRPPTDDNPYLPPDA